jgi:hypothetical protein
MDREGQEFLKIVTVDMVRHGQGYAQGGETHPPTKEKALPSNG